MTGREPQELFDDATMTWYWQRWVQVDPGFAQIINHMLNYRPSDRYQSAMEVLQAMQSPTSMLQSPTVPPVYQPSSYEQSPPDVSRAATMAVGREPVDSLTHSPGPVVEQARSSIWDDPLAVTVIGIGVVILTGIASWAIVRAVVNPNPPSPTPTQTQTATPVRHPQRHSRPNPRPPPNRLQNPSPTTSASISLLIPNWFKTGH